MHEAHGPESAEHEVGSAGELPVVQPVSETASVKRPPKDDFRPGVPAPDPGHHPRSGCTVHYVRHRRFRERSSENMADQSDASARFRIKPSAPPFLRDASAHTVKSPRARRAIPRNPVGEQLVTSTVPIIDLFSGPGGLAEGFSPFRGPDSRPGCLVAVSVEMDATARRTPQPRAFFRKFGFPNLGAVLREWELGARSVRKVVVPPRRLDPGAPCASNRATTTKADQAWQTPLHPARLTTGR